MKRTIDQIKSMKNNELVSALTCYDYSFAQSLDDNVDLALIGDSLGNVVYGNTSTRSVTMEEMISHTIAVRRGAQNTFLVSDIPYLADKDKRTALINSKRLLDAGADAVKIEGKPGIAKHLTDNGIEVMGHIGHLPQTDKPTVHREWNTLQRQASDLELAGCFAVVLEMVQADIAEKITKSIAIPTIGIGAGSSCDGQILVLYDMLGLFNDFKPKFVKRYAYLSDAIKQSVSRYTKEVKTRHFPSDNESYE